MRSIITSLVLLLSPLLTAAQAGPQIQPGGANRQIQWPTGCTSGLVYSPATNTCVSAGSGGTSAAQTNFGLGSSGATQMIAFGDSTLPGGVLVVSGAPVNGNGTNQCPGPGSPAADLGLTYYRYDTSPAQIFYCDLTQQIWKAGQAYSSTAVSIFQNYNQQSPWSTISATYPYAGTPYSNDSAPLNTGNALSADVANIEVYPNENPPDFGAPDYYTQTGAADALFCYTNCDLGVRGSITAMWMWLGTPLHGKLLAQNATKTGTWTNTDPTSQTTTATWSAGATTMTVASATGVAFGQHVVDTTNPNSIVAPTVVIGVSGTTMTVSRPFAVAGSSDSVKFWNTGSSPFTPGVATCGTTGGTLTFNTMPASGALYLAWLVNSGGTATANLVIDGGSAIPLSDNVLGTWSTSHGSTMWYGQRFPISGTGAHTAVITVTAGSFCPLFAVTPNPSSWSGLTLPSVFAGIAPPTSASGYSSNGATVKAAQVAVSNQMKIDGFHLTPVDFFNQTWPEGKGSTLYCEFNYPCSYPNGLTANQSASPHTNMLGNTFNYTAFAESAGRTATQVGDVNGLRQVTGLSGIPFCTGFSPSTGQNIQLTTVLSPTPCWTSAAPTSSGMTWNGAWSGGSAYTVGNTVSYNGVGYVNIANISAPASAAKIQTITVGHYTSGAATATMPSNVSVGDVLVAMSECRFCDGTTVPPTDSRGDNTWTRRVYTTAGFASQYVILWTTTVHSSGAMTVTSSMSSDQVFTVTEFSNVTETPTFTYQDAQLTSVSPTVYAPSVTLSGPGVIVGGLSVLNGSSTLYTATGTNMVIDGFNGGGGLGVSFGASSAVVPAGTYANGMSFPSSGSHYQGYAEAAFAVPSLNPTPDTDSVHWFALGGTPSGGTAVYTSSHTATTSDAGKLLIFNCSSACALTLPNPQPSTTWVARVQSVGSTLATVTLGSSMTYNGVASSPALIKYLPMYVTADTTTSTNYSGDIPPVQGANMTLTPATNGLTYAASGGGGFPTPETHTASSSATLDFTTCITSSYKNYKIMFDDILPATNSVSLLVQVSSNGGSTWDTTSANYQWGRTYERIDGSVTGGGNGTNPGFTIWNSDMSNTAAQALSAEATLYNPLGTTANKKFNLIEVGYNTSNNSFQMVYGEVYTSTSAINALRVIMSSGNIASGTVTCQPLPY